MKLIMTHGYMLSDTGSNVYVQSLCRALARKGHEVHLLCQEPEPLSYDFVDEWAVVDEGSIDKRGEQQTPCPGRCTVYRPEIGDLLPVYVYDDYPGWRVKTFLDLTDDELENYVEKNIGAVRTVLAASGAEAVTLEADEVASGVLRATPEQVSAALVEAFGGPAEESVPVIVLNGNGVPGIGEAAAERLLPGGFRVAVSQNASDFDHPETLIVVGSPDDVGLAERVRDLLGVGSVSVSVGSGIAPVTVVIGKDFTG